MNPWNWLFGRFIGGGDNAFRETTESSIDRANVRFLLPDDSRLYIGRRTRKELNEKAEWLWQNFGVVKEGVGGIARHVVGKGISLQLDSEDSDFNERGEADFESYFLTPERCDLAGRRNGYEAQTTAIEQRMVRGEFFAAHAENPEWDNEPCFQLYDTEEVCSPHSIAPGKIILDGVELNANSRATNYYVRGGDCEITPIERARMMHWYKPHSVNQVRGITELAQAVNPLVDIHELKRLTTRSAKAQQLIALVLKGVVKKRGRGALGAISAAGTDSNGNPNTDASQLETLGAAAGAGIAYLDNDEHSDAKLITPNSPTPLVEGFITDLLMRDVFAGAGVPSEFFWNTSKLTGANTRFILARADLFFQIFSDRLVDRFCRPMAFRYLSHRIQHGKLKAPSDPNWAAKMSWQMPERVTVDNGRDGKLLIELLGNGMITLREYCNKRGLNYRSEMRQWIREPIEFIKLAEKEGAPPEMLQLWKNNPPMWRASKPGAVQADGADPTGKKPSNVVEDEEEEAKAA